MAENENSGSERHNQRADQQENSEAKPCEDSDEPQLQKVPLPESAQDAGKDAILANSEKPVLTIKSCPTEKIPLMNDTIEALHMVAQLACDTSFVMQFIEPGFTFAAFASGLYWKLAQDRLTDFKATYGVSNYSRAVFAALREVVLAPTLGEPISHFYLVNLFQVYYVERKD